MGGQETESLLNNGGESGGSSNGNYGSGHGTGNSNINSASTGDNVNKRYIVDFTKYMQIGLSKEDFAQAVDLLKESYFQKRKNLIPFTNVEISKVCNALMQTFILAQIGASVSKNEDYEAITTMGWYAFGVVGTLAPQSVGGFARALEATAKQRAIRPLRELAASLGKTPGYGYTDAYLYGERVAKLATAYSVIYGALRFQTGNPLEGIACFVAASYFQKGVGQFAMSHVEMSEQEQQAILLVIEQMKTKLFNSALDIANNKEASANDQSFSTVVNEYLDNKKVGSAKINPRFAQLIVEGIFGANARHGSDRVLFEKPANTLEVRAKNYFSANDKKALQELFEIAGYGTNGRPTGLVIKQKSKARKGFEFYLNAFNKEDVFKVFNDRNWLLGLIENDIAPLFGLLATSAHMSDNKSEIFAGLRSEIFFWTCVGTTVACNMINGAANLMHSDQINTMFGSQRELVKALSGGDRGHVNITRNLKDAARLRDTSTGFLLLAVAVFGLMVYLFLQDDFLFGATALVAMALFVRVGGKFREQAIVTELNADEIYKKVNEHLFSYLTNGGSLDVLLNAQADTHGKNTIMDVYVDKNFAKCILDTLFSASAENYGYMTCVENNKDFAGGNMEKERTILKALFAKAEYGMYGKNKVTVLAAGDGAQVVSQVVSGALGTSLVSLASWKGFEEQQKQQQQQEQQSSNSDGKPIPSAPPSYDATPYWKQQYEGNSGFAPGQLQQFQATTIVYSNIRKNGPPVATERNTAHINSSNMGMGMGSSII